MKPTPSPFARSLRTLKQRGSILLATLIISVAVAGGLVGYINLSHTALKNSQRSFYLASAGQLAEAGMEEAVYCFRLMDSGTAVGAAWTGWTLNGPNATFTLPAFAVGQNAIGTVKVYVAGYDGTVSTPSVYVQATILPIDGTKTVSKSLKLGIKKKGPLDAALIGILWGVALHDGVIVDSYNSNPTGANPAVRVAYPGNGAAANGHVMALDSEIGFDGDPTLVRVKGNAILGPGVYPPDPAQITGRIITDYTATYAAVVLPVMPFPLPVGHRNLSGIVMTGTYPRVIDVAAADGRFYYYTNVGFGTGLSITAGRNVTIVVATPATTILTNGLTLGVNSTAIIWCRRLINHSGTPFTNPNWPGALRINSAVTGNAFRMQQTTAISASIYAPEASVDLGSPLGTTPSFTGAAIGRTVEIRPGMKVHYDESLKNGVAQATGVSSGWAVTRWSDLHGTAEAGTLATLTGGFLN